MLTPVERSNAVSFTTFFFESHYIAADKAYPAEKIDPDERIFQVCGAEG